MDLRGAVEADAVTMNILPGETACLACLFPQAPSGSLVTCDTAGILNTGSILPLRFK